MSKSMGAKCTEHGSNSSCIFLPSCSSTCDTLYCLGEREFCFYYGAVFFQLDHVMVAIDCLAFFKLTDEQMRCSFQNMSVITLQGCSFGPAFLFAVYWVNPNVVQCSKVTQKVSNSCTQLLELSTRCYFWFIVSKGGSCSEDGRFMYEGLCKIKSTRYFAIFKLSELHFRVCRNDFVELFSAHHLFWATAAFDIRSVLRDHFKSANPFFVVIRFKEAQSK